MWVKLNGCFKSTDRVYGVFVFVVQRAFDVPEIIIQTVFYDGIISNGDRFFDLAIGVPDENLEGGGFLGGPSFSNAGVVNVLYGWVNGLSSSGDQVWDQADVGGDVGDDESFGFALAVGDFNGDGLFDLAIGAPGENVGVDTGGDVSVLYGKDSDGLDSDNGQQWSQGKVAGAPEQGDALGSALHQ